MKERVTLTRKAALKKLKAVTKAIYYIQVEDGTRYFKAVTVEEMLRAFESDDRARLRIRLSDSQHTVTITDSPELRSGYDVWF